MTDFTRFKSEPLNEIGLDKTAPMKITSTGNSTESIAHIHWGGAFFTGILLSASLIVWVSSSLIGSENEKKMNQGLLNLYWHALVPLPLGSVSTAVIYGVHFFFTFKF